MIIQFPIQKVILSLGGLAILFTSCSNSGTANYQTNENGLQYRFFKKNEKGKKAKEGETLMLDMVFATEKDSIIYDSRKEGMPALIPLTKPTFAGGIEEGFLMLNEGDSASFIVNGDSLYQKTFGAAKTPGFIKPGSGIKFYMKVNKVMNQTELQQEQMKLQAKMQAKDEALRSKETPAFLAYAKENNINPADTTATGLIYKETKAGTGKAPTNGKSVKVNYVGKLLNGTVFDSSIESVAKAAKLEQPGRKYEPISFQIGSGQVIPGWDEGIGMMKTGGKATLIIPSKLAYGGRSSGPIPAYSTLVFDVELVEAE